jgi:hypothetical protein
VSVDTGGVANRSHRRKAARDDIPSADGDDSGTDVQLARSSAGSATAAVRWAVVAAVFVLAGAAGGGWDLAFGSGKLTLVGAVVGVAAVVVCAGCVLWARHRGTEVRFLRPDERRGRRPPEGWTWDAHSARWRPPVR